MQLFCHRGAASVFAAFLLATSISCPVAAQMADGGATETVSEKDAELLKNVFPDADRFSVKGKDVPYHKAYKTDPDTGENTLIGFAFQTKEIEPREWGYGGKINVLVGMTPGGAITAVHMLRHFEPFGYFSIDPPDFAEQFPDKSILDDFEVGKDIHSVTSATITVESAARTIRKSARTVARHYLQEQKVSQ